MSSNPVELNLNDDRDARWFAKEIRRAAKRGHLRAGGGCTQECEDACSGNEGCALCTGRAVVCVDGTVKKLGT